jgi:hypothetical protein
MVKAILLAAIVTVAAQPATDKEKTPRENRAAAWQALFDRTAAEYEIYRDRKHTQRLQLHPAPLYKWKAASASDGIFGSVYVWTYQGCAENVVCFWRCGEAPPLLKHEIQSLSPEVLEGVGASRRAWKPTAGMPRQPIDSAPAPAAKAPTRLAQMRRLADAFSGYTEAAGDPRRELRLLPTPLYRYESTDPDVLDGALFGFVCTVGTDPEAFLLLEARRTADGPIWHYTLARFSHADTFVSFAGKPVWKSVRGADDTFSHSADHTYLLFDEPVSPEPGVPTGADTASGAASQ